MSLMGLLVIALVAVVIGYLVNMADLPQPIKIIFWVALLLFVFAAVFGGIHLPSLR
jgi:hypothetical protein